jgi:hypothetical protein
MAIKKGNSGQHFAVRLDSPVPSDPTTGLADLCAATVALRQRLDSLETRNVELEPTIARIEKRDNHDRKSKNPG